MAKEWRPSNITWALCIRVVDVCVVRRRAGRVVAKWSRATSLGQGDPRNAPMGERLPVVMEEFGIGSACTTVSPGLHPPGAATITGYGPTVSAGARDAD